MAGARRGIASGERQLHPGPVVAHALHLWAQAELGRDRATGMGSQRADRGAAQRRRAAVRRGHEPCLERPWAGRRAPRDDRDRGTVRTHRRCPRQRRRDGGRGAAPGRRPGGGSRRGRLLRVARRWAAAPGTAWVRAAPHPARRVADQAATHARAAQRATDPGARRALERHHRGDRARPERALAIDFRRVRARALAE